MAIDGSKLKAVNNRDKKFTPYKVQKRIEQIEASIAHYLAAMDATDRRKVRSRRRSRLGSRTRSRP